MKTQEEYALEIDEIVRRDVESRQSVAWYVDFSIGSAYYSDKYNSSRVRAVIDF